jgi:hypothetical protein
MAGLDSFPHNFHLTSNFSVLYLHVSTVSTRLSMQLTIAACFAVLVLVKPTCAQIPTANTTGNFYPANPDAAAQTAYTTCLGLLEEALDDSTGLIPTTVYDQWQRVNPGPYLVCHALESPTGGGGHRILHPLIAPLSDTQTVDRASNQEDEGSEERILARQAAYYQENVDHCLGAGNETLKSNWNYFHQPKSQDAGVATFSTEPRYLMIGCGKLGTTVETDDGFSFAAGSPAYCACAYHKIPSESRINANIPESFLMSGGERAFAAFALAGLGFVRVALAM